MKDLAVDESLSEEARDSARKALEVLVSSQLLDIEQTAALKKLESEVMAKAQAAEAEVKGLVAEAQSKRKKVEAKKMLQEAEHLELSQSAQGLSKEIPSEWISGEMAEWLSRHRLESCATDLARIAGACDATTCISFLSHLLIRSDPMCMAGRWSRAICST